MKLNNIQKKFIADKLANLKKSKFRSSFKLSNKDKEYIHAKSIEKIEEHCEDFINTRLAPSNIPNDGKQTPMRGHPVFISQHATATCCRSCLEKWHHIPKNRNLTVREKDFIKALIIEWIKEEIK